MNNINWKTAREFEDITYKKCDGVARIARRVWPQEPLFLRWWSGGDTDFYEAIK